MRRRRRPRSTCKVLSNRLDYLNGAIGNGPFLMGEQFTVADAYLFTVLGWSRQLNFDLGKWPQLQRYMERVGARPQVIEAQKAERLVK